MQQRLGDLLVTEKLITSEQLENAVEAQCLYGGRIGTSLIELGYLGEEEIAQTLSRKLHLPYIEPHLLMKIPSEVIALLPKKLAWRHLVIPCRLEKKRLYLAMSDPTNLTVIDAMAFRLGFIIVPVVVPELRLMMALQKYYQLELSPRFISLSQNLSAHKHKNVDDSAPVTRADKKQSKANSEEPILEVSEEDVLKEKAAEEENWPLLGEKETLDSLSDDEYQDLINMPDHLRLGPADSEDKAGADSQATIEVAKLRAKEQHPFVLLCRGLTTAEDRDDIAAVIIDYIAPICSGAALLMIKDGEAMGWKAAAEGEILSDFDQLHISLVQPSVLKTVADSKVYYFGTMPTEANNILISSYFGHQPPETILLIPLLLRGRLVTMLYLQDTSDNLLQQLPDYQKLIDKTAMAFEMLILRNKIRLG